MNIWVISPEIQEDKQTLNVILLSREREMKPQCEIAVYRRWKQGQAMKNEFRNIFWTCKDNTSKAKAYSKFTPIRGIKGDKNP